jgi:hypothetical protein
LKEFSYDLGPDQLTIHVPLLLRANRCSKRLAYRTQILCALVRRGSKYLLDRVVDEAIFNRVQLTTACTEDCAPIIVRLRREADSATTARVGLSPEAIVSVT